MQPDIVTSVGMLNACASVVVLEEGSCVHSRSFKVDRIRMSLWGSSLVNMCAKMWEHG